MKKIKLCPCCGSQAKVFYNKNDKYGVKCTNPKCFERYTFFCNSEEDAISEWNNRIISETQPLSLDDLDFWSEQKVGKVLYIRIYDKQLHEWVDTNWDLCGVGMNDIVYDDKDKQSKFVSYLLKCDYGKTWLLYYHKKLK